MAAAGDRSAERKCWPRPDRKWARAVRSQLGGAEEPGRRGDVAKKEGKMAAAAASGGGGGEGGGGEEDEELRELLESALDDFEKTKPTTEPTATAESEKTPKKSSTEPLFAAQDRFFHELFDSELAAEATKEFDKAMQELAEQEPHLVEQFHKLSEIAGKVGSDPASKQEFSTCLQQTLSGLAKNASDLQSADTTEEELNQAMSSLGVDLGLSEGAAETEGSFLPIMQNIMQNLLSKDILYPSLKEITDKYPDWLAAHRHSLPGEQVRRYERQQLIMGQICQEFEAERRGEPEDRQQVRFETILDLMQQLQDLGEPPKELADVPPGLNFDLDGINLPENAALGGEQCAVM
ncbi:peroxisomal biogenesis factor 19 isoform X1 [Carcharodon carcharias]|uniref:peroxisomal biogenesis factor 19 isoform X1 n=1 Tax=Carcharodon carcharias TaxID=13397 RepID=UPI001B7F751F|nr:peroxisomal biogenesis factor 19 isoform X1 [Carcharodon carcharias]